ncbi:MAG TPA: hypothetical protein V6D29_26070 [Leptolyngbyaceae cyanobacterium]
MSPTAEDRIKVIKCSLAEFKKVVDPILDVEMIYFDRPNNHTLREAIQHFEEALGVNWRDYDQAATSDELVSTFAQVARNLPPRALKEAIEWMHFATQDMLLLRERG